MAAVNVSVPETIACMECGGLAHALVRYAPDAAPEPGDIVPYRCAECAERWDVVLEEDDGAERDISR